MNSSFDFEAYTAEIEYRANRIRRSVGRNRRTIRVPFVHHEEVRSTGAKR